MTVSGGFHLYILIITFNFTFSNDHASLYAFLSLHNIYKVASIAFFNDTDKSLSQWQIVVLLFYFFLILNVIKMAVFQWLLYQEKKNYFCTG